MPLLLPSLFLVLLLSLTGAEAALDLEQAELVWHDEFQGSAVDWDKWVFDVGDGCDVDLCDWGNEEQQYYRSENAAVTNGVLEIKAQKEDYSSRFYTSSKLTTKNKFSFRYGRVEARIRLPPGGQGLWPAFWMMPQDNAYGKWAASGEIDIFESRNNFTEVINNLNYGNAFPNNSDLNGACFLDVGTIEEYHVYAVEWDDEEIVWSMDDLETCRVYEWFSTDVKSGESRPKPAPFDQDFYLVINMAVGGNDYLVGTDPVDDSALPAVMEVDYVRVYQAPEMFDDGDEGGSRSVYLRDATGGGSRQGVEVWGDEFSGSDVSGDWEIESGVVCLGAEVLCENEDQAFFDVAVAVGGGVLNVTADAAGSGTVSSSGRVTLARSGLLHTTDGFAFEYGRLETTLSAPSAAGVVSTVSLIAANNMGQVEVVAVENGVVSGGIWNSDGNYSCTADEYIADLEASDFNTFAVEWTEDRLRWYAAGRQYCEVTSSDFEGEGDELWPFGTELFVSVGVSVGRGLGGGEVGVNESSLPVTLSVEAVRAHQFNDMDALAEQAASAVGTYQLEGNLTWQDEFDGVELDAASQADAGEGVMGLEYWWNHEEGDGCEQKLCGFGNGEAQWYRKENAAVKNGKLIITTKAELYAGNIFTSAKLSTKATVGISYGRIETRVKLPKAQGLWPSIWMLPVNSPYGGWPAGGSINIFQSRNEMSRAHGQAAFGGPYPDLETLDLSQGGHCYSDLHDDLSEDYHVYALEWEVDAMRWYVDGVLFCDRNYWYSRPGPGEDDYPFPAPFDTGFYLTMNVAVGGSFTGGLIDEEALAEDAEMLVDYVRVYQVEGQSIVVADPAEASTGSGGAVSVVTAVSVLVVLGILFFLCFAVSCVAKRRSKRAEQAATAAAVTGDGSGGGGGHRRHPISHRYNSFHSEKSAAMTPPVASGGGGDSDINGYSSRKTPVRTRGFAGGDGSDSGGGGGVRGGGKNATGSATKSPLWGRWAGADESRTDVTPGRLRQRQHIGGGDGDGGGVDGTISGGGVGVGVVGLTERRGAVRAMQQDNATGGTIPEDWVGEVTSAAGDGGGADARGGMGSPPPSSGGGLSGGSGGGSSADSSSGGPVRTSSVELAIEGAIASSAVVPAASPASCSLYSSDDNGSGSWDGSSSGDARGDETVWMGGGGTIGSTDGSGLRQQHRQEFGGPLGYAAGRSKSNAFGSSTGGAAAAVGAISEASDVPPTMRSLRLDRKPIEDADPAQTGLPSYEEAISFSGF